MRLLLQMQPLLHQHRQPQEFLVRETTRSQLHRAWAFLVQSAALATILSLHPREWVAQAAHVLLVALVAQAAQVAQVAHRVPVVHLAQVASQVALVQRVLVLHVQVAHPAAHQAQLRVDSLAQVAAQAQVVVEVLAVEPQVLSVRAAHAVRARHVSQSAQSAKSSNSAAMRHHLVARWFHAVTVQPFFACVADLLSKTSQTRLTPMQVS